jgi:hypothetical protein
MLGYVILVKRVKRAKLSSGLAEPCQGREQRNYKCLYMLPLFPLLFPQRTLACLPGDQAICSRTS